MPEQQRHPGTEQALPRERRYRNEFQERAEAERYDVAQYGERSWSTLVWQLEQDLLNSLLDDPAFVPQRDEYLDFACGTGRITGVVGRRFGSTVGLDISPWMLDRARARAPWAAFVEADVTGEPDAVGRTFDLITAFRFVLNADRTDRQPVLSWMRSRLRDERSRVIVNNHGNLVSHKAMSHAARRMGRGSSSTTGNVLSHREMVRLVTAAGFVVDSVHGMGHFGGHTLRVVPFDPMLRVQRGLRHVPGVHRLGEDQVYVLAPQ